MKRIAIGAALAALLLAGSPGLAQNGPREYTVVMDNMVYGRMPAGAKVGDTIIWVNNDSVEHSVTARDGSFDLRLLPGRRGRTVLRTAGNLRIYCIMHPMMRTALSVAAS